MRYFINKLVCSKDEVLFETSMTFSIQAPLVCHYDLNNCSYINCGKISFLDHLSFNVSESELDDDLKDIMELQTVLTKIVKHNIEKKYCYLPMCVSIKWKITASMINYLRFFKNYLYHNDESVHVLTRKLIQSMLDETLLIHPILFSKRNIKSVERS